MENKFFIGWSEETPTAYIKTVKKFVWLLVAVVLLAAFLLVKSQKEFATSTFEYGKTTVLEGTLIKKPAPMLRLYWGNDLNGKPVFQHVLLVAFGKFGAEKTLSAIESEIGEKLEGQAVKLQGTLIYHDGKTTLELSDGKEAWLGKSDKAAMPTLEKRTLGTVSLHGEIIDPKCFFGVMKPGEGKPHKSCAARCISGGIPPVFAATNSNGEPDYYLLVGKNGEKINRDILPFVADYLQLSGKAAQMHDWKILYLESTQDICPLGPKWIFRDMPMCAK